MALDVDVGTLSAFASLTESSINNLINNPSSELVRTLLTNIEKKVKDYNQIKSQKTRLEVELETVTRTNESKIKVLQTSRDRAQTDLTKTRDDLQLLETARARAQADLESYQQSSQSELAEATTLRSRVSSLESSQRDALALITNKQTEISSLADDLRREHEKVVEFRRQLSALEQAKQEASSAATSARFKQDSLQQEIDLQKKNIEWLEDERKAKSTEYQKFRLDKNARIAGLQQEIERLDEETSAVRRAENSLKAQLEAQVQRNDQLLHQNERFRTSAIEDASAHKLETDNLNRLLNLRKSAAEDAKARIDELTTALDETRTDSASQIAAIEAQLSREQEARADAENKVKELETRILELEANLENAAQPVTPREEPNGFAFQTPVRAQTPLGSLRNAFTPRSSHKFKNGMSVTQIYTEYKNLERDLARERSINEELQSSIDDMLRDMESTQPRINELQSDLARLQEENVELTQFAEQANEDKNAALRELKVLQGQLESSEKQLQAADQMVRDRNSQVRRLLLEQQSGVLSDIEYDGMAKQLEEMEQREMQHLSNTQQEVNQHLIGFRNITELQKVNAKQLDTIRNLATELENDEAQVVQQKFEQLEKDFTSAQLTISQYQDEMKAADARLRSFAKERDMFRGILTRRGVDPTVSDFSRSMPAPHMSFGNSVDGSQAASEEYAKLLKDMQIHFDDFKREASADSTSYRRQIAELSQRNSDLQGETSRTFGQITAANERYEILQSNFQAVKNENEQVQKRLQSTMENCTKQEVRAQQASEELISAQGMLDSLRRESANLKAEKELWKTIEKRLLDDNELLRNERARLDQLNLSLQNLLNEKEQTDSESRRRLQIQIDNADAELQTTKRRLETVSEENRQAMLRHNYEIEQRQSRIDDLVAGVASTREELSAAISAKDLLETRVDEMTVELRSAEERLIVLQKPTVVAEPYGVMQNNISREQELEIEISDIKRDLDLKTAELSRIEEQVQDYRSLAEASEQRLQEFIETSEQDKADLQSTVAEKEQHIEDLKRRLEDISAELTSTNTELSKTRDEQSAFGRKLEDDKTALQVEIDRLRASEAKALQEATYNLEVSKQQAQIATEAQDNYNAELSKHARAAEALQVIRSEKNHVFLRLKEVETQVTTYRTDLERKETSWTDSEAKYKSEALTLKERREEALQQNKLLHEQMETLTRQIASLRQQRASNINNHVDSSLESGLRDDSNWQEVISYIRKEKETVEIEYQLSLQRVKRLEQQLESTQTMLDDTRLKLDQQRRAGLDAEKSAISQAKLMETITDLNLYKESNATLRQQYSSNKSDLEKRTARLQELELELPTLNAKVEELESLLELRQGEYNLLQKDRDGWQQRTQNILSKYDRVDPAELEELKGKLAEHESVISQLQVEKDEALSTQTELLKKLDELQSQVDSHPSAIETAKADLRSKLKEQFTQRDKESRGKINQAKADLDAANAEKADLEQQLQSVRDDLLVAQSSRQHQSEPSEHGETEEAPADSSTVTVVAGLENKIAELEQLVREKDVQVQQGSLPNPTNQADEQLEAKLREAFQKEVEDVRNEANIAKDSALDQLRQQHEQELAALRTELARAEQAINHSETMTDDQASKFTVTIGSIDDAFTGFMMNMNDEQAKALIQKQPTINRIVKDNIRKRVESAVKEALAAHKAQSGSIADGDNEAFADTQRRLGVEREEIIAAKQTEFDAEKAELVKQHEIEMTNEINKAKETTEKMIQGKINLIKNQAASAQAKISVIKKAVEDTPDKPVKAVWEVASKAKPGPTNTVTASTPAKTTPAAPIVKTELSIPVANGTNDQGRDQYHDSRRVDTESESASQVNTTTPATLDGMTSVTKTIQSSLPVKPQASGIPRGGTNSRIARAGSAIPSLRGRGRGGRGSSEAPARDVAVTRDLSATGLNPTAGAFSPNKRSREEDNVGDAGNVGKRIRGSGQGGQGGGNAGS